MERFDLANLDQTIEQPARDAMLDVILTWARLDTLISKWMSVAFGTTPDATVILMGNMATKNKIEKLKALYLHFGFKSEADRIGNLLNAHAEHADLRNTIAHVACMGQIKGDPQKVVFQAIKRIKSEPGHTFVEVIHLDQMRAAAEFALGACDTIIPIIDGLLAPLQGSKQ